MVKKIYIVLIILLCFGYLHAQETKYLNKSNSNKQKNSVQVIFDQIEKSIAEADIPAITRYLSSQTYISLSSGVNGYYSSNQAYYVLENFFKVYHSASFKFQNTNINAGFPYATGVYNYDYKGKREAAQVYIALKSFGSNWKITQLTIN